MTNVHGSQKLEASVSLIPVIKYRYLIDLNTRTLRTSKMKMQTIIRVFLKSEKRKQIKLNSDDISLLTMLSDRMDTAINCHPSYDCLLEDTGIGSKTTLCKSIRKLESLSIIKVVRTYKVVNVYYLDQNLIDYCLGIINPRVQKENILVHFIKKSSTHLYGKHISKHKRFEKSYPQNQNPSHLRDFTGGYKLAPTAKDVSPNHRDFKK